MDKYDIQLLHFHRKWQPFGGPSDYDIFVEFGLLGWSSSKESKRHADVDLRRELDKDSSARRVTMSNAEPGLMADRAPAWQ